MANAALLATLGDQTSSQAAGSISSLMPSGVILPFGGNTPPNGWLLCDGSTISRTVYADLFQAIGTAHGRGDGSTTFNLPDFRGRFMRGVDGTANRDPDKTTRAASNPGGNTGNNVGSAQSNATAKNGLSATAGTSSLSALTMNSNTTSVSGAQNQWNGNVGWMSGNANHAHSVRGYGLGFSLNEGGNGQNFRLGNWNYLGDSSAIGTDGRDVNHYHSIAWSGTFSASGTTPAQTLRSSSVAAPSITVADGDNETRPLNINVQYIIKV